MLKRIAIMSQGSISDHKSLIFSKFGTNKRHGIIKMLRCKVMNI